jgi:two-component system sensor kinase FixL
MTSAISTWRLDFSGPISARGAIKPILVTSVYIAAYIVLDRISMVQELPGLGFTLWNPPPACSLALLLIMGLRYAPAVFAAGVISDGLIVGFPVGLTATFVINAIIALGYFAVAAALRHAIGARRGLNGVGAVIALLGIVGIGVLVIASVVGAALIVMRVISPEQLLATVRHFWIGDLTGIVGLLPALIVAPQALARWNQLSVRSRLPDVLGFALGLALALWIVFGIAAANEFRCFYLLLLPVVWVGVRHGLAWCAMAVVIEQLALIAVVTLIGYSAPDFLAFQVLSLVISTTGLMLGAIVTERQQAETRLRHQQIELERMARLTTAGALGSTIAHEVSQPLATIATYAHACRRLLKSQPEVLGATLEKLEGEALRAGEIVDRLRDFLSKGEARMAPLDFAKLTRDIVAALADEGHLRAVAISIEAQFVPKISADRIQMGQVLMNLLRNAIDAAAEGPGIERRVRLRVHHRDDALQVEVEDSGKGIAPDFAERLFEPFETNKQRGMGLGLLLARQIVESHGGQLWWDRDFSNGARFVFRIPCKDGSA